MLNQNWRRQSRDTYNIVQRMKTSKLKEAIKRHTILDKEWRQPSWRRQSRDIQYWTKNERQPNWRRQSRDIQYWTKNENNQTKYTTHKTKNTPAHQNYLYYALGILNWDIKRHQIHKQYWHKNSLKISQRSYQKS